MDGGLWHSTGDRDQDHPHGKEMKKKKKKRDLYSHNLNIIYEDFPGGPVVKTLPSNAGSASSVPGWAAKILYGLWLKNENIKQK